MRKIHVGAVSLLVHIFYPELHGFILKLSPSPSPQGFLLCRIDLLFLRVDVIIQL